jgi:cystathionine beta-lyase/cystathionine gamma-synthase
VETISNPQLRVCDLAALADAAHDYGARLLVDNTFAGPTVCRPLEFGADLVVESLTKIMSGHSDVLLGLLCGRRDAWPRVASAMSTWGWSASPFDCWLAARGLASLALRAERAGTNALAAANFLAGHSKTSAVQFPGLPNHPDHTLASRQFQGQFGSMVTFTLAGGRPAAEKFIAAARGIPFCPSLGDISTTLSHPESTSHRSMPTADREAQGIFGGTIRLSLGVESAETIVAALEEGLAGLD